MNVANSSLQHMASLIKNCQGSRMHHYCEGVGQRQIAHERMFLRVQKF